MSKCIRSEDLVGKCNWFENIGRFLCGLDGVRPYEFYEIISGYHSAGQNYPTIYGHEGDLTVLGRNKKNRRFKKECKNIKEAIALWKENFDPKMISKRIEEEIETLLHGYSYFSGSDGGRGHKIPTMFAVGKDIYVMGIDIKNNKPFVRICRKINEAAKIWKEMFTDVENGVSREKIYKYAETEMKADVDYDGIFFLNKNISLVIAKSYEKKEVQTLYLFWHEKGLHFRKIISVPGRICNLSFDTERDKTKIDSKIAKTEVTFSFTGGCSLKRSSKKGFVLAHWHSVPIEIPLIV